MQEGLVSVLMAVYNGAQYVTEAVQSILSQTYKNLELIVVNDCSTDQSEIIVDKLAQTDNRIRLYRNAQNSGLAASLKMGLEQARGEYIARMDADDIAVPERFQWQVAFLQQHSNVDIVGSWKKCFGSSTYLSRYPEGIEACKATMLFGVPVGHPCVMMRHQSLSGNALTYDASLREGEDYDLWFHAWKQGLNFSNIPKVLLKYRAFPKKSKTGVKAQRVHQSNITRKDVLCFFGMPFNEQELAIHHAASTLSFLDERNSIERIEQWLLRLKQYNDAESIIVSKAFNGVLAERFFYACYHHIDKKAFSRFNHSELSYYYKPSIKDKAKWLIKSL